MKKLTEKQEEVKQSIKKSIEAKKKALSKNQIIFKDYGYSKI
jgi:hypothetical protein